MKRSVAMAEDVVLYEVDQGVALLTLNRPERMNAWTGALEVRYFDLLQQAADDPDVGAIVVTGAGRGFCPGADMALLQGIGAGTAEAASGPHRPATFPVGIPKPLIAAINGACAGIGLVHALMADVRFAAAGAKFTTAFARRGLIAEHGVSWLLPHLVGTSRALDLLMSARVFTSEEAHELGLVNRVLPREQLLSEALAYGRDVASNCSPASLATIKRQVYAHSVATLDQALEESDRLMRQSLKGPDFKEGVASYVEKRPPAFAPLDQGTLFDW